MEIYALQQSHKTCEKLGCYGSIISIFGSVLSYLLTLNLFLVDSTNFKRSVILVKNLPPSVVLVYYPIWPTLCGVQIFFNSIAVMRSDNVNSILQYVEDSLQHYPKQTVQFHHDSAVLRIHPEPTNMHHARKQSILSQKNNNMLTW